MMEKKDLKPYIMMIASMVIFGTIGLCRRMIPLSSAMLSFLRGLIGGTALLIWCRFTGKDISGKTSKGKTAVLILNGVFLGLNWLLLFEGFRYTTIAKATLAYYMQPVILLVLSAVLFKERMTLRKGICALFSLAGMVLVSGVLESGGSSPTDMKGILFGLAAACLYAMIIIINKQTKEVDTYRKTIIQLFSSAAVLLPYLLVKGEFTGALFDMNTVIMVLTAGIIHTAAAYALYFGSIPRLKAHTISAFSYIDPVTAMIISALFLQERMTYLGAAGALIILVSAYISETESR